MRGSFRLGLVQKKGESLKVEENVALAPLTTFGVGGAARYFVRATSEGEVAEALAWAAERGLPVFVLGGGSNLLVRDDGFAGLVLQVGIPGTEDAGGGCFSVGAGEPWDEFVTRVVGEGFAGVECMAGIPGSVGGTPVQNVGAYGQEVSETIASVRALDRTTGEFVELDREACRFRYRESLFNKDEPGRYIVTLVRFCLRAGGQPTLKYAELRERVSKLARQQAVGSDDAPSLELVANVVREIRRGKGMLLVEGDADCRSAGSFFKNPIVSVDDLERVKRVVGREVPHWAVPGGLVKLPAAWLLEQSGFVKGFGDGPVGVSTKHTLALTNRGGASFGDVERMQQMIVAGVMEKFGVKLEREPVVLG